MNKLEEIMICVDAGGTSCKAAIFQKDGQIIAKGFGKSGSPAVSTNWYLHIDDAMIDALSKIDRKNFKIVFIQIGASGISALNSHEEIEQYFVKKYSCPCNITSDTLTALYSVLDENEEEGIVVISGTGVGIFGKNKDGKTMLIGGWGHLIREYGSAYSIVHMFCINLVNHYEETGKLSILEKLFLEKCRFTKVRDLNHLFYQRTKDEIASLSVFFKEEANKGNVDAIHLLKEQGHLLGGQVKNLMRFLNLPNKVKIGLRGGFLEIDGKYIIIGINEYFKENNIELSFEKETKDQLVGVYQLARKNILMRE